MELPKYKINDQVIAFDKDRKPTIELVTGIAVNEADGNGYMYTVDGKTFEADQITAYVSDGKWVESNWKPEYVPGADLF